MRHADRRHLATLCAAPEARQAGRPRHLAGRHFEGAAGAGGAAKGRRLAADREVDAICDAQRRRTRNYLEEYRGIDILRYFAMLNAEELGITSKNIDTALESKKPDVMRFVGTEGEYGEGLGLTNDWAVRIIRRVGNYGEVYERNVGTGSKLGIPRGLNQLWNAGGILYAPPIR